ncbi:MAG TPA: hypothetical protein VN668_00745 [Stellaceae bacterium]|nr:hypothetical protein [Stellaceae bacterium]
MIGYGLDPEGTGSITFQVESKQQAHNVSFSRFNVEPSLDLVAAALDLDCPISIRRL